MKSILLLIAGLTIFMTAHAEKYSYNLHNIPLSQALIQFNRDHSDINLSFIYKELDTYHTSAKVSSDNPYEALRQIIGFNPVSIIKKGNDFYIEALQHGRYSFSGQAIGTDNEPVAAATVMLLSPKDSTVITYGMTDNAGHFSIPCDRAKVIAKLSCLGYRTIFRACDSFNVGTIIMKPLPLQLKGVKVEAENTIFYSDRSIYMPTQRQKSSAQNAIDLLRQMAIPQININLMNNAVTTLTGQDVDIFINYMPASSEEMEGLRTSDVRKIEYLDFSSDPRFNGCEHVVNFIIQKYEYGGYTKASVSENFLVGLSSRASIYSKFAHKRMSYDFYAGASNHDMHHSGTSIIGRYDLSGPDGNNMQVTRNEIADKSHFKYNQYPVTFRAIYESDKTQIANTVGFNFDQSPVAEISGDINYQSTAGPLYDEVSYNRREPYTTRYVTWNGRYYFILPHNFHLNISPSATYSHTGYTYSYQSDQNLPETIDNISKENIYQFRGSTTLYKIFSGTQNGFIRAYGGTIRNDVNYYGSAPFANDFTDTYAGGALGYNYNRKNWNFNADVAIQWERNGINSFVVNEVYPLFNISASFAPSSRQSLRVFFHFGANYPGASEKSPNILQQNELMFQTGNPDLKLSRQTNFNIQYSWTPRNNFSTTLFGQYFGEYGLYIPVFRPYNDGKALLKSYESNSNYHRTQIGLSFNYKLMDGKFQLAAQPSVSIYRMTGYYNLNKSPFQINGSATYYLNNFYFQASYQTAGKTLQGNRAVYYRDRDFYQILAGWSKAGWNIRLTGINLLRNDWICATQTLVSPLYSETRYVGGNYSHRRLNLSVTYTFNYGKKVQQGNEIGEQSGSSSAIMK
ncbi:MAG: hypothetical protein HFJ95_06715 [Muribaculaceae bacterium]|nr:hypothetical protein [Muribaculaceae bacterium]